MEADSQLEQVIRAYFDAAATGDPSWARDHVAQHDGLRVLGTGPDEFFAGADAYRVMTGGTAHLDAAVSVDDLEAHSEGSVGWGMARVKLTLPDAQVVPVRWSAVFRREGDKWKAVQIHASVPAG